MIKEKITQGGRLTEITLYPCFENSGKKLPTGNTRKSSEAQAEYNRKKKVKEFCFLLNENFNNSDYIMTITYDMEHAPLSYEEHQKNIVNFFRRLRCKRKSLLQNYEAMLKNMPNSPAFKNERKKIEKSINKLQSPLKYSYDIEEITYKTGKYKGLTNYHSHLILSGGMTISEICNVWGNKGRTKVDRFLPEKYGFEAWAKYMVKESNGRKSFVCSKNLSRTYKKPRIRNARITPGYVAKLAKERIDDSKYWENRYKGYSFMRCVPKFNEYNGHWYINVMMYQKNAEDEYVPKWDIENDPF